MASNGKATLENAVDVLSDMFGGVHSRKFLTKFVAEHSSIPMEELITLLLQQEPSMSSSSSGSDDSDSDSDSEDKEAQQSDFPPESTIILKNVPRSHKTATSLYFGAYLEGCNVITHKDKKLLEFSLKEDEDKDTDAMIATISFPTSVQAIDAVSMLDGHVYMENRLRARHVNELNNLCTLGNAVVIENVEDQVTKKNLVDMLSFCGDVKELRLSREHKMAIGVFETATEAKSALMFNSIVIEKCTLKVRLLDSSTKCLVEKIDDLLYSSLSRSNAHVTLSSSSATTGAASVSRDVTPPVIEASPDNIELTTISVGGSGGGGGAVQPKDMMRRAVSTVTREENVKPDAHPQSVWSGGQKNVVRRNRARRFMRNIFINDRGRCRTGWFAFLFVVLVTTTILVADSVKTLNVHYVGLDFNSLTNKINPNRVYTSGTYFLGLSHDFLKFPVTNQVLEFSSGANADSSRIIVRTGDGARLFVQCSVVFRLRSASVISLYRNYRTNYRSPLQFAARAAVANVAPRFSSIEWFSERIAITKTVKSELQKHFNEMGVDVIDFFLFDVDIPPAIEDTIIRSLEASLAQQEATYLQNAEITKSKSKIVSAIGGAKITLLDAVARANITVTRANAYIDGYKAIMSAEVDGLEAIKSHFNMSISETEFFLRMRQIISNDEMKDALITVGYGV